MKHQQRSGLLGSTPKGPEYMREVNRRAKRMEAATKIKNTDQLTLPFAPALKP